MLAQPSLLRAEKPEWSKRTGLNGTRLLSPAYWVVGREQKQQSTTDGEVPSLGTSREKPFQTPRRPQLPPEKGTMTIRSRDGRREPLCYQKPPFSQGLLFLKSPRWSGFCLVWRSSNLTADFSGSEKWLMRASASWGKVAKLPNLFFLLKTEEEQHLFNAKNAK